MADNSKTRPLRLVWHYRGTERTAAGEGETVGEHFHGGVWCTTEARSAQQGGKGSDKYFCGDREMFQNAAPRHLWGSFAIHLNHHFYWDTMQSMRSNTYLSTMHTSVGNLRDMSYQERIVIDSDTSAYIRQTRVYPRSTGNSHGIFADGADYPAIIIWLFGQRFNRIMVE